MKKAILLAAVLSFVGGSAIAGSWGSFGSFHDGYKRDYQRTWSYSRDYSRDYSRIISYFGEKLEFCGCGDFWTERCDDGGHEWPGETPEVPLPAAGFLLLGALGGIAALKRNKK